MRFLLVHRDCQISGGTTYLALLAEGLLARGHEVVLAAGSGMAAQRFEDLGVRRLFTVGGMISSWLVHREASRTPPDVVVYSSADLVSDLANSVAKLSGGMGLCVLGDQIEDKEEARRLLEADAVVVLDPGLQQQALAAGVPADRLHSLPRPVVGGAALPPPVGDPYRLVWLGRMNAAKAWSALTLIEAMPGIVDHIPGVELWIVGGGAEAARVRRLAKEINQDLGQLAIQVLGPTNHPLEALRGASLVIGGRGACLEALYNGRPAIAAGRSWLGPVSQQRLKMACTGPLSNRPTCRTDAAGMAAAVCEVYDASLLSPVNEYTPRPDWFGEDHTVATHAEQMTRLVESIKSERMRRKA